MSPKARRNASSGVRIRKAWEATVGSCSSTARRPADSIPATRTGIDASPTAEKLTLSSSEIKKKASVYAVIAPWSPGSAARANVTLICCAIKRAAAASNCTTINLSRRSPIQRTLMDKCRPNRRKYKKWKPAMAPAPTSRPMGAPRIPTD
jgi:hypothetical protein